MCYLPAQKENDMSEIHNQREIELLEAQLRECRAENANLRAALQAVMDDLEIIAVFGGLDDGFLDDIVYTNARAALGGEND